MGLRDLAEADLGLILEDSATGFGYAIVLTSPAGVVLPITGFSNDIAQVIDPDTGQVVSGRLASVALRISTIIASGLDLPRGIANSKSKPWIVEFNDLLGNPHKFKVFQSNPDRTIGMITLILESYA
jgi:hypothetical protein